jgi:predicted TIM-barrel fold metal-dependent hydrolase
MTDFFDSMAHPTLSGAWLNGTSGSGADALVSSMAKSGFSKACAVGLAGVEGYSHERFLRMCEPFPQLIPIAGIDPHTNPLDAELDSVAALGFRGIKVHPRFSRFQLADEAFRRLLSLAAERGLVVFLCTYFHAPIREYPLCDPLYDLVTSLQSAPDCRLVLVHGGDFELMRYVQFARHSPNVLVDLSHTIMKYAGSSLDLDVAYLFRNFSRRICIGSDFPEYGHKALRERFESLADGLDEQSRNRIASENLEHFLGVEENS